MTESSAQVEELSLDGTWTVSKHGGYVYPHWVGSGRCSGSFRSSLSFSVKSGAKSLTMNECGRGLLQVSGEKTHELVW